MNDYERLYYAHLCPLQQSFACLNVFLFLSNQRKSEELFLLEIALELFLWSSFTLDRVPRASEKFPLLILRNAFWLLPPSALTLVQCFSHCHGKCSITFKIWIPWLKIAVVASHDLNRDIQKIITWPLTGAQPIFMKPLIMPCMKRWLRSLLCLKHKLGERFNAVNTSVAILLVRVRVWVVL